MLVGGFGCCFNFGEESFKGTVDIAGATFSATPEPASWALMIVGFGAVGATMRRRRFVLDGGRYLPDLQLHGISSFAGIAATS